MTTPRFVFDGVLLASMKTPESVAIVFGDETISYGELAWRLCRVASGVDATGARRVAVSLPNHPALLEIFFGATLAGAVFVLFDPKWPRETLDNIIKSHQPQFMFVDAFTPHPDPLPQGERGKIIKHDNQTSPPEGEVDANASGEGAILVDLKTYPAWRDGQDPNRVLLTQPTPKMPFLVGFTSGTTGIPKAFIRSHASWTASFAASHVEFDISTKTNVLLPGPLSHGLSLYAAVETLNAGGTVTLEPTFDAPHLMYIAGLGQVNTIVAAPTLLDLMLAAAPDARLEAITTIITAGAKLLPSLRERLGAAFPQARIIEYYGASELSFVTVARSDEGCPPEAVGRAFNGVEIKIEKDAGDIGTVWVRSAMIAAGYVGPTDGTGLRINKEWATVGDRGHIDARGFLTLVGRDGDMIITGGLNVYPTEVEAVLAAVPGVAEVWVTGEADERWGEVVTAIIAPAANAGLDVAVLKQTCAAQLVPHKIPRRWFITDAFAHTSSGKIDRAEISAKLRARALKALL